MPSEPSPEHIAYLTKHEFTKGRAPTPEEEAIMAALHSQGDYKDDNTPVPLAEDERQAQLDREDNQRQAEAEARGNWANAALMFARTMKKFAAGGEEGMINILHGPDTGGRILYDPAHNTNKRDELLAKLAKEQKQVDFEDQHLIANSGLPGFGGEMAAYMLTGGIGNKASNPLTKFGMNLLNKIPEQTVNTIAKTTGNLSKKMQSANSNLLNKGGKNLSTDVSTPNARAAMRMENARLNRSYDPSRKGMLTDILNDALLGAGEGALHYDMSAGEGVVGSLFGHLDGLAARKFFGRSADYWEPKEREVVEWFTDQHGTNTPGMRTGNFQQQQFEKQAESRDYGNLVQQYKYSIGKTKNRIAWKAAGLDVPIGEEVTSQMLKDYKANLKKQYQALEASSGAKFNDDIESSLIAQVADLSTQTTPTGKKAHKMASSYLADINKWMKRETTTDASGNPVTTRTLGGGDYQKIRERMKVDLKSFADKGDWGEHNALKNMVNSLDSALALGLKDKLGSASPQQWKDLHEKYAMTNLLFQKGTDVMANFDGDRLLSNMKEHDAERLLLGNGGRIKDLQKLLRYENLEQRAERRRLGQQGDTGQGSKSLMQKFLDKGFGGSLPFLGNAYMQTYMRGTPSVTGFLNLKRRGLLSPMPYTRASGQAGNSATQNVLNFFLDRLASYDEEEEKAPKPTKTDEKWKDLLNN